MDVTLKRRRLRIAFSLRTLFIFVTLLCAWLGWQRHVVNERKALIEELRNTSHFFYTRLEAGDADPALAKRQKLRYPDDRECIRVSGLRHALGDSSYIAITFSRTIGLPMIHRVETTFPEAELYCGQSYFSDSAFRDSLYMPGAQRKPNKGDTFKTGLME